MLATDPYQLPLKERVRWARKQRGLTQDQLADRIGAKGGRWTVITWEKGDSRPSERFLDGLAEATGQPRSFFEDEEEEPG